MSGEPVFLEIKAKVFPRGYVVLDKLVNTFGIPTKVLNGVKPPPSFLVESLQTMFELAMSILSV